jgi:hypothetical protein
LRPLPEEPASLKTKDTPPKLVQVDGNHRRAAVRRIPVNVIRLLAASTEPRDSGGLRCWRYDSSGTLNSPALTPRANSRTAVQR